MRSAEDLETIQHLDHPADADNDAAAVQRGPSQLE
jgi:hypothetical protein